MTYLKQFFKHNLVIYLAHPEPSEYLLYDVCSSIKLGECKGSLLSLLVDKLLLIALGDECDFLFLFDNLAIGFHYFQIFQLLSIRITF